MLSTCSTGDSDPVVPPLTPPHIVVPLVVGNQWAYADTSYQPNGSMYADSSALRITRKITIEIQGSAQEAYYWNWLHQRLVVPRDDKWLCANAAGGLFFFGGATRTTAYVLTKTLVRKYPVSAGESWTKVGVLSVQTLDSTYFRLGDTTTAYCVGT